jgi:N-acyl-phosphatidylethanolamine-hydrolysing phospholipase D
LTLARPMEIFGKRFRNTYPHLPHTLLGVLRWKLGLARKDPPAIHLGEMAAKESPIHKPGESLSVTPVEKRIRTTWIGHSTFLIQHHGLNILTDPIFGDCGPLPMGGLRRVTAPGISLDRLPKIHHVLISHSHYDHLDAPTIRALGDGVRYWVPEGLCAWFRKRGITSCEEIAWWQSASLFGNVVIHSVPAQHASGRTPWGRDRTHWCGWVLKSSERTAYFAGDTGYSPSFREIGKRFGGFDLSMIPIGAYNPRWLMRPMHLNPAEAVKVHMDVNSRLSIACHWGTFRLTDEPLSEPPELLLEELGPQGIDPNKFRALQPGETVEV